MKLLLCTKCSDVFSLRVGVVKTCSCGACSGQYVDRLNAKVSGGIVIGFSNPSLVKALLQQQVQGDRADGLGHTFTAFIIPNGAESVDRSS